MFDLGNLHRITAVADAVCALDHRQAVDHHTDRVLQLYRQQVTNVERQHLAERAFFLGQHRDQLDLRRLHLGAQVVTPGRVFVGLEGLHLAEQQRLDWLQNPERNAQVHAAFAAVDRDGEAAVQHHLLVVGDAGKLETRLLTQEIEFDLVHRFPGLFVLGQQAVDQASDDAQLDRGVFLGRDLGRQLAFAAEHVVDRDVDHLRIDDPAAHPAQRPDVDQVDVRAFGKSAYKSSVRLELGHHHVDFNRAPNHVVEREPGGAGKALVDQLERWHAPLDHAVHLVKDERCRLPGCRRGL